MLKQIICLFTPYNLNKVRAVRQGQDLSDIGVLATCMLKQISCLFTPYNLNKVQCMESGLDPGHASRLHAQADHLPLHPLQPQQGTLHGIRPESGTQAACVLEQMIRPFMHHSLCRYCCIEDSIEIGHTSLLATCVLKQIICLFNLNKVHCARPGS